MRVLLVEDEKALAAAVKKVLGGSQIVTDTEHTGTRGLDAALSGIYDAIILDVMLPGMDGFSILRAMRQEGVKTPVLMLTARAGVEDRIQGLELGADYYLPKPFEMAELLACLHAITRRTETQLRQELTFGDVELVQERALMRCKTTGQEVRLGAKEYQLAEILFRSPRQILPKATLTERVWGYDSEAEYNSLEVYISFVRKKLSFVGSRLKIKASRGVGYSLEDMV